MAERPKKGSSPRHARPATGHRTGTVRRIPKAAADETPDADISQIRLQVAAPRRSTPKGMALRWKIVLAMGGIIGVTALLNFVLVYTKASGLLENQINDKGVRLVNLLAAMDRGHWAKVIEDQNATFFTKMKAKEAGDILDAGVVNVTIGNSNAPAISIHGPVRITLPKMEGREAYTIRDRILDRDRGRIKIRMRTFVRNSAPNAEVNLRYYAMLSMEEINSDKSTLLMWVFMPIFISVLLAIGIAIWISMLITEPIKILIDDMQEVSAGNLDHRTRAVSKDEIGLLAGAFNRMTAALRTAHQQELEAKAMEHELSIASEIQSNLVPKRMLKIPGYDIGAYYRPSKEVGGDYYDFIEIDQDNEGIIVADVSGKGVPGSLVMSMARAFIRMEAERSRNVSPSDTLIRTNRMLAQDIKKGMFVTALYCILNKKTHEMRVASAGHNPMVVWRAASNKIELVNPSGIALGFDKGPVFERTIREEIVALGKGDRVLLFTDGTVEMMNSENQEFGDDRFYRLAQKLGPRDSNQMINLVIKVLDDYAGDAPQHDDITLVTVRRL